jgi:hypothetical protein
MVMLCGAAIAAVAAEPADSIPESGIHRAIYNVGAAIDRGATAAAKGIQRGAAATERGIRIGLQATARGIERGAQATTKALDKVAGTVRGSSSARGAAAPGTPPHSAQHTTHGPPPGGER